MIAAMEVAPRAGYRIWLRYSDGVSGEVDLSDMAGRGVFKVWLDHTFFEGVHVSGHGSIAWSDDIELCADALYMELTGKSAEDLFPALRGRVPELSRFYGIVIRTHFREQGPPHFHAEYAGVEALIRIDDSTVLNGKLPRRALGLVREWAALHREELRTAWDHASRFEDTGKIAPLE